MVSPFNALLPCPYTNVLKPVMALPTMSVCISRGFVTNFAQEVMKGRCPGLWRGLSGQRVAWFGRSEALVSLFDPQLPFLDHVHECNADER